MQTKDTRVSYKKQRIFIGIDVHKKSWTVTIIISGLFIKTFSMNPHPEELVKYLQKHYPEGKYYSVYEAGFSGYWAHRKLCSLGIENIVVNPADIPTNYKEKSRKTDKVDSRKLARELSNGSLKGIFVPKEEEESERILNRIRIQLTNDQTRIKNRIKSMMNYLGINLPANIAVKHWSKNFINYLETMEFKEESTRISLSHHLEELKNIRSQISRVVKELRKIVTNDEHHTKVIGHLQSIPGVGFITAITMYTEILDIKRFKRLDELSSYVGLAPSTYSSGEKERVLGISKRQKTYLRNLLIEASWIAVRKDPAMTMSFGKLTQRLKKQEAIIRIAKKLLNRIMYVWKNETDYVLSVIE